MQEEKKNKTERVLEIYTKLMEGKVLDKRQLSDEYGVDERSVQRDIDDVRSFLENHADSSGVINHIVYDRMEKGYRMEKLYKMKFSNSEVLAICKILLDSRAFTKSEMDRLLLKLIDCCVPEENQKLVTDLIRNEAFYYVEPGHKTVFIDKMWEIGKAIQSCNYIEIDYQKLKGREVVKRKLRPLAIMFSEYYFYLAAFIDDKGLREDFHIMDESFPTIYRLDRIKSLTVLDDRFRIPYHSRFEEGKFRKSIQFMYGGELQRVKFKYHGVSIEAVLDRLPTAKILGEEEGVYTVEAEVFGYGIEMWLRSQGEAVEVLKPDSLREKMKQNLQKMLVNYE